MSMKNKIKTIYDSVAMSSNCVCEQDCSPATAAEKLGYSVEELSTAPAASNLGLSCGNPLAIAGLKEGEYVLDLGSGAGFDSFQAAAKVAHSGKVVGIDFSIPMVEKARSIAVMRGISNVAFIHADIEALPVKSGAFDIVISNCVLNLVTNKEKVYQEVYRALKTGGRISIADVALLRPMPANLRYIFSQGPSCLESAITVDEYLGILEKINFQNITITTKPIGACFAEDSSDPLGALAGQSFCAQGLSPDDYITSIQIEAIKG